MASWRYLVIFCGARLTPFPDAGTQVKWNRQDPHIVASAHAGYVLLWDDRKGALPLATVHSHHAKIYGLDWSRNTRSELVTCSMDASVKRFSTLSPAVDPETKLTPHLDMIKTSQPVWRARYLPFGNGVLSLPQRGSETLQMFTFGQDGANDGSNGQREPIAEYERSALVKEYVWRSRGGIDSSFGT